MEEIHWEIPRISDAPIQLTVNNGDQLFIVGANGSGKSTLIQRFVKEKSQAGDKKIKRITAHRQTWFDSGNIDFTPAARQEYDRETPRYNTLSEALWRDLRPQEDLSAILFDLVAKENSRARAIARHVDNQDLTKAQDLSAELSSPFDQINELLDYGKLKVTVENSNDQDLLARHLQGESFSIAEMSDGERSAVIIAAHVITAESGTVFLIDEPERHLHRYISQPFFSALFALRSGDCAFIIATHEIALPVATPEARVIMLRSCQWTNDTPTAWDAELLEPNSELPPELKLAILGSRKKILFVEGQRGSLDVSLYSVLFPTLSVNPIGSCEEVQKAVRGLRVSQKIHHMEAFGLIDRDNRADKDIEKLAEKGIFALKVYSVEALYYCSDAIDAVAHRQAGSLGINANELIESTKQQVIEKLKDQQLAERMAARRCERQIQKLALSNIPDWKSIRANAAQPICVPIDPQVYLEELDCFNELVKEAKIDQLIARYPLRDSCVFEIIARTLECQNQENYQRMVLVQIENDKELACKLKSRIDSLPEILNSVESLQNE